MCYSLWYNAPMMLPAFGRQHRTDGRTDMTKPRIHFRSFANAPNKWLIHLSIYEVFLHKILLFLPYKYRYITEPTVRSYVFPYPAAATEICPSIS